MRKIFLSEMMTSGVGDAKIEVFWSPANRNHFVTRGSDISLYEVGPLEDISNKPSCIKLSESTGAHLVASNNTYHYIRCVELCPQPESETLLALGQANGKIILTSFGPTAFDSLNGKELVPRHARQCNAIAWNAMDTELLAVVLDKYRNDHCILLWDITKSPTAYDGNISPRLGSSLLSQYSNLTPAVELARPVAEMGLSEMAHSLAWLHRQPRTLAVGMNSKQIKIFDLRDITNKAVSMAATKAVFGVCVDPHNDYQLASRLDNIITIWDRRSFDKPIITLNQNKAVTKIMWCPTRRNLLGFLQRDSLLFHLADLRGVGNEEEMSNSLDGSGDPPSALERSVIPGAASVINSFSWHPTDNNRLLTATVLGTLIDYTVCERITLNWGFGSGPFVWSHGNTSLKMLSDNCSGIKEDISVKIKRRASTEYGLKPDLWQNGDLAEDELLKKMWYWLYISRSLVEEGCIKSPTCKHPGIKTILKIDSSNGANGNTPTSHVHSVRSDFSTVNYLHNTVYRSEDRDKALNLCGWIFDKDSTSLISFLERLEAQKAYTRAAAIAVFNMKLRHAIEILNKAADKSTDNANLGLISMALSGYSDPPGSVWKQSCSTLRHITDPYVRVIFSFLTSENGSYDGVLNEMGINVDDKIAFACMFLPDAQLSDYINQISHNLIDEGNLAGILLIGTMPECISLLQQYLDNTGDVQSVSLIAARSFTSELLKEPQVADWITSYRNLLDSCHFWTQRALFDIMLNTYNPTNKPTHQVYVSCNFCGKDVSANVQGLTRNRNTFARIAATSSKFKQMSACPNCRKPLPRCAICLLHVGAHGAPGIGNNNTVSIRDAHKSSEFSSWFTWCQTCRHGGHAAHITQWFQNHVECPVTSCTCHCFTIDSVSSHSFLQSTS